jgi:hypothetical protein
MRTFTGYLSNYASLTDSSTSNATLGATLINDSIRTIYNIRGGKWWFLEDTVELQTIAGVRGYEVPNKMRKIMDVYTNVAQTIYMPEAVYDPARWKLILAYQLGSSDVPYFYYRNGRKLEFAPIPATDGNVITVRGRLQPSDLTFADYTTGTIVTIPYSTTFTAIVASGATSATLSGAWGFPTGEYQVTFSNDEIRLVTLTSAATTATWDDALTSAATATITVSSDTGGTIITGSGTSWTTGMAGRYIKITATSAANGGDGEWYEIATVYDTTHLALVKAYEGTNIAAGSATYTMGQTSLIPEAYDMAVIYRSVAIYWRDKGSNTKADMFWKLYDGGQESGILPPGAQPGGLIGQMIENETETVEGSYIPPFASTANLVNTGAWWSPWQGDGSGF